MHGMGFAYVYAMTTATHTTDNQGAKSMTETETVTVYKFSAYGPCLTLGTLVKETAKFYVYQERGIGGRTRRIKKSTFTHTERCRSCSGGSLYPDGYMD